MNKRPTIRVRQEVNGSLMVDLVDCLNIRITQGDKELIKRLEEIDEKGIAGIEVKKSGS